MNDIRIRAMILEILARIAPEADLASMNPELRFRDQFEFDSIDCLNLTKAIEKELGITIPEEDYPRLASLDGCIRYLGCL